MPSGWTDKARRLLQAEGRSTARRRLGELMDDPPGVATRALRMREYRQTEALCGLYAVLQPDRPLPTMRGWAASPDVLLATAAIVLERRPEVVVEFGSGASSIVLGLALRKVGGGVVHSIDHDAEWARKTSWLLADFSLQDTVTVSTHPLGPITDPDLTTPQGATTWYSDVTVPDGVDLAIVDGPVGSRTPMARYPALPALHHHLSPGATVVVDDAGRRGESAVVAAWLTRYPQLTRESIEAEKGAALLRWRSAPEG